MAASKNGDIVATDLEGYSPAEDDVPAKIAPMAGPAPLPTRSVDEVAAELQKSPFFMTSLPQKNIAQDNEEETEENLELAAMQALQYEGTRAEIAGAFRENGNEMAKEKKWSDAREFYNKALAALKVKRGEEEKRELKEKGISEVQEGEKEKELEIACLGNRALCQLELKNYRACTLDCQTLLTLSPTNLKAHYRLATAHLALSHLPQALSAVQAGLSVTPTHAPLLALLTSIEIKLATEEAVAQKKQDRETRVEQEAQALSNALKMRMIRTRATKQGPDMDDASIKLVPDPLDVKNSTLVFPVVLLYPMDLQSDFVKAFGEEQTPAGHLKYLFPLPWDEKGEYTMEGVDAYLQTKDGGLIKWGKKVPLLKVLSGGKVEVVDGIVRADVVPKGRAAEYIQGVRERKGKS